MQDVIKPKPRMSNDSHNTDEFIRMMTEHQIDIEAFIMSSLGDYANTQDVLQKTNVALWKKVDQFRPGAKFMPWALQMAKYEILTFMRSRKRDRLVFRPELVELMIDLATDQSPGLRPRMDALRDCIKKLPDPSRELLAVRYSQDHSIKQIAEKTGRSVGSVKNLYMRIRNRLRDCIARNITAQAD